jgi:hypothetical protein
MLSWPVLQRLLLGLLLLGGIGYLVSAALLRGVKRWFGLSHPSWTHAPALGVFSGAIAFTVPFLALGEEGPIAYVNNVNQYPSLKEFLAYFVPIGILVIGVSVLIDELWARQEVRKSFNWMSLLDEAAIGFMIMLSYGREYDFSPNQPGLVGYSVGINTTLVVFIGAMIVAAAVLELLRRPAEREAYVASDDASAFESELQRRTNSGERISYFEGQNPVHLTVLVVVACAALVFAAVMSWRAEMPWVSLLSVVAAGAFTLLYGGIRVSVTSTLLDVRLGMLGIRLLTLPTAEIGGVTVNGAAEQGKAEAADAKREIRAFSLSGNRGVRIITVLGRQYLIGSDHPERLAAVLRAVTAEP